MPDENAIVLHSQEIVLNSKASFSVFQVTPDQERKGVEAPLLCLNHQCECTQFIFNSNQELFGLSINGTEGSKGFLEVRTVSGVGSATGLRLRLPFQLDRCPVGFKAAEEDGLSKVRSLECETFISDKLCV